MPSMPSMASPPAHEAAGDPRWARLVARDAELAAVGRLLAEDGPDPAALVLEGRPGVGKTSLWETGLALAAEQGLRVLVARASGAETGLSFAALVDLFDQVGPDELAALPSPQRRALEVALYRADPDGATQPHAVALGVLSAVRALAARERLLVAIDDLQWLDPASEQALAFVARRLSGESVRFLLARRPGPVPAVESAFPDGHAERLEVTPMSLGASRQLLSERLGLRLPHHLLRRVYDATLGNPLFTLEVGRMLAGRDAHALGHDVPVPEQVEDALGMRVATLDGPVRRVLLALALHADLRVPEVDELAGAGAVHEALREGVVRLDGERVRPAHPLLAAAVKQQSTSTDIAELHRAVAEVVSDEEARALHLALATPGPDEVLARRVSAAAARAAARGATVPAAELADHALRLTPAGSASYVDHLLDLGERLGVAGEKQRLTDLIAPRVSLLPTGAPRVAAHLLLTSGVVRDNDDIRRLEETALEEAGEDHALQAPVLARLADNEAAIRVANIAGAAERAQQSLRYAVESGDVGAQRLALYALAWTTALGGHPVDDLCQRHRAVSDEPYFLALGPERVAAQRHVWRGEIAAARDLLTALQRRAEDRGEPSSIALDRLHLCELALRAGDWAEAERLLEEWAASTDSELLHWPMYERCRALLACGRGDVDEARRWGEEALRQAGVTGVRWDWLEASRALGTADLLAKDLPGAADHLGGVWDHTEREGVGDPGAFPAAPDLVEALAEAGGLDRAREVTTRLAALAESHRHPWAAASATRCAALLELAAGAYTDRAAAALEEAASAYSRLGLGFDEARTLLALGRAQRRARKWGAARATLERAAAAFDLVGSGGWADDARSELARVGARRPPSAGQLTRTERRVAELAAEGRTNKEIARTLVVTVSTVEFHLRNAYAKLGVRSRTQLAGWLHDQAGADR